MTRPALLEQLDLPTRRTHEAELGGGDLGIVQHQRVELMEPKSLSGRLDDDQAARIAKSASAAFAVEKLDQAKPLSVVSLALAVAIGLAVFSAFSGGVSIAAGRSESRGTAHPWTLANAKFGFSSIRVFRDGRHRCSSGAGARTDRTDRGAACAGRTRRAGVRSLRCAG